MSVGSKENSEQELEPYGENQPQRGEGGAELYPVGQTALGAPNSAAALGGAVSQTPGPRFGFCIGLRLCRDAAALLVVPDGLVGSQ